MPQQQPHAHTDSPNKGTNPGGNPAVRAVSDAEDSDEPLDDGSSVFAGSLLADLYEKTPRNPTLTKPPSTPTKASSAKSPG